MDEKINIDLGNVQKTLFLPLWGRAIESKKEKPLLMDETALGIMEKVNFDFTAIAKNISELSQTAWILRSICVDEVITNFLAEHPKATIVNIGYGLDTTFDRVDNGTLTWYDLDLPDVIHLRKVFIEENVRRKFIPCSFLEDNWLNDITVTDNVLFIAAGVFYYFKENEIRNFLIRLADNYPGCEIIFDVSSPYGVKIANRIVIKNAGLDKKSYLTWGLKNPSNITTWDSRIRIVKTIHYFREKGSKLKFRTRMVGQISDWLNIQYMLHLQMKS